MYKVYWTETRLRHTEQALETWKSLTGEVLDPTETINVDKSQMFQTNEMDNAMELMADLRKARREHAGISFITLVSEHPDSVGEAGVDSIKNGMCPDGVEYTWMKRRTQ